MTKKPFFGNWDKIKGISFGLVLVLFNLWIIFHIPEFAPAGQEDVWYRIFISYGMLSTWIFSNADMRSKLFNVKFVKFLPRLALYFGIFLVAFYFLMRYVDPTTGKFTAIVSSIPLHLALAHAFTFASIESTVWQGYLDEAIGRPFSALSAGIFHLFIWSGGAFLVIISASLLFLFFSFVHYYFRKSKSDLAPVIGCHTAYNFVKLGILLGGAI